MIRFWTSEACSAMLRWGFATKTPNCDKFILSACILLSLLFVFHHCLLVLLLARRCGCCRIVKKAAVVYQHRCITSISKQPFHVLIWICHAWRLQLSNEACAIQQEVRRKSTQRASPPNHARALQLVLISPFLDTRRKEPDATQTSRVAGSTFDSIVLRVALRASRGKQNGEGTSPSLLAGRKAALQTFIPSTIHRVLDWKSVNRKFARLEVTMKQRRLTVNTKKDSGLRFHCGACHTQTKPGSTLE